MTDKNGNPMDQTGQSNDVSPEQKKATRSFLLNPVVMVIEAIILIGLVVGITLGSATPKDHFTGIATVEHVNGGSKKCWVDLRTEDGTFLNDFRMSQDTCESLSEGDVVEVIKGKYLPEIAHRPY
jgi:hypothetical protein